jgi:hypothetical protein
MMGRPVITPELIAHHRRLARELRNAAIRKAMLHLAAAFSKSLDLSQQSRTRELRPLAKPR